MKIIGLTGSIAMGKTHTARLFAEQGIPIFDSDAAVHRLYAKNAELKALVRKLCPQAIIDGTIDRQRLSAAAVEGPQLVDQLEAAVHPLVRREMNKFLHEQRARKVPLVLVDVPLLFETGREKDFDVVVVVTAPPQVQKERALARPGMTQKKLDFILSRQTPDSEKRARADFVVDTGKGEDAARSQVQQIVNQLRA